MSPASPLPPAREGEINYSLFDRFTLVHGLIGVSYALLGLSFLPALLLALAWELVENPLKTYVPRIFPNATRDTLRNALSDILAVLMGWGVTSYFAGG